MNPVVIVTGSTGQLGSELRAIPEKRGNYIFISHEQASITEKAAMRKLFLENSPDYFINCAAYTAVDLAETESEKARQINAEAVGILASLCKEFSCRFIHISTDYVFSGKADKPLKETDATDPVNMYGRSKWEGEQLAFQNNPESLIIRTSWVYSSYGRNFVKTMLRLMAERPEINVVSDQFGSPTYAADLAGAIVQIVNSPTWVPGIFHYSNEGNISWFEFAKTIRDLSGATTIIHPIPTSSFPTPARRPLYSVMDKTRIKETYELQIKDWDESLRKCLRLLQSQ